MNIKGAGDKAYEEKGLKNLLDAPPSALEGLSDKADGILAQLGVNTIRDLGEWKYAHWARAIVELAKLEE